MYSANLAGMLDGPAQWGPERPAILTGERVDRTWEELAEAVARRAGGLRERHKIEPGDAVAIFASNHAYYLEVLFSIWHAGAVAVPISNRLHPREAADIVDRGHAKLCFATADVAEAITAAVEVPVLVFGEPDDEALLEADTAAPAPRGAEDDAWIFFTSGTTGKPKGARLSHLNLFALGASYLADSDQIGPADSMIHIAAFSHASGLMSVPFLARGASQVLPPSGGFDADEMCELIGAGQRSSFFVPPVLLRRMAHHDGFAALEPGKIGTVLCGAAPVMPSELRDAVEALGPVVWNGYGQGESPCTITANGKDSIAAAVASGDEDCLRSVGVARVGVIVRVVDEDDNVLPVGEVGEVAVDGPTVMSGYLDMPEATATALRGGVLHTGDLGFFDEQGRLTLVDRAKDVIITGGYNVYPREVEDVLEADPAVGEVAVVGAADPEWGERIIAFVVPAEGAEVDVAALDKRCLDSIARHKRPKSYEVVEDLPRNTVGKVLKSRLRELAEASDASG